MGSAGTKVCAADDDDLKALCSMPLIIGLAGALIFVIFGAILIVDKIKYKHVVNLDDEGI